MEAAVQVPLLRCAAVHTSTQEGVRPAEYAGSLLGRGFGRMLCLWQQLSGSCKAEEGHCQ